MGKRLRDDNDYEFEDFGYTIQNRKRITKKKVPKLKKDFNDRYDSLETDHQ